MANLKSLRTRIASVRSTFKITRAMQMVAASRLRIAREDKDRASSYTKGIDEIAHILEKTHTHDKGIVPEGIVGERPLVLLITANRGLCGGFNNALIQKARQVAKTLEDDYKNPVAFLCLGSKGYDGLLKILDSQKLLPLLSLPSNNAWYDCARQTAKAVLEHQETAHHPYVVMVSSRFINVTQQESQVTHLLPFEIAEGLSMELEPQEQQLMKQVAPLTLEGRIFSGILGSTVGEQAARMTSMDSASRNAQDMAENLNLLYNRARQAMITSELTEMISSVENL